MARPRQQGLPDFVNPPSLNVHSAWWPGRTVVRVSGARENRAAVFASEPQEVEVQRDGAWWPGALLGWRHEADGSCRVSVRLAVTGAQSACWVDLWDVRLPQGARPADPVPTAAQSRLAGASAEEVAGDRGATRSLAAVVGHSRAESPLDGGTQRPGGRRRAPEEEGWATAVSWDGGDAHGVRPPLPGRHRAPAVGGVGAGRHRATDTGVWPALAAHVVAAEGGRAHVLSATVAPSGAAGASGAPQASDPSRAGCATDTLAFEAVRGDGADGDAGVHPYTRPMRLQRPARSGAAARWSEAFDGVSARGH